MMVNALYSCSVNMVLTIWCENVILDREILELALWYTASEKPYAPPMTNTMSFPTYEILSCRIFANSVEENSFPCSSSRITSSAGLIFFRIRVVEENNVGVRPQHVKE